MYPRGYYCEMNKNRLEAFSDGVLAIVITIMVLEFKRPAGPDFSSLMPLLPVFLSYVLSFVYVGIYWNNHHHLLHATQHVSAGVLWANLHLLVLALVVSFRDRMARRGSRCAGADRVLRSRTADGSRRLVCIAVGHHLERWTQIRTGIGAGTRLERQAVSNDLSGGDTPRILQPLDFQRVVHDRRPALAGSRPPD